MEITEHFVFNLSLLMIVLFFALIMVREEEEFLHIEKVVFIMVYDPYLVLFSIFISPNPVYFHGHARNPCFNWRPLLRDWSPPFLNRHYHPRILWIQFRFFRKLNAECTIIRFFMENLPKVLETKPSSPYLFFRPGQYYSQYPHPWLFGNNESQSKPIGCLFRLYGHSLYRDCDDLGNH